MSEAAADALPDWMGGADPSQIGFPFEVDRSLYVKETGLAYKQTADGELMLDAYRPTRSEGPAPLVVMIHGGGWRGGGRYQMGLPRWAGYLASAGVAVVSIDYRLAPATSYPDSFQDCVDAVDWAVEHAQRFGADPERVGLFGDSAGGHLVLLLGTSQTRHDYAGPRLQSGGERIKGVVAWYPPTDLLALHAAERRAHDGPTMTGNFVGAEPDEDPARWQMASPIEQVHGDAPPTLILQGTRDILVPHAQALAYAARAEEHGAAHELHIVEDGVHGFDRVAPGDDARRLIERSRAFLLERLVSGSGVTTIDLVRDSDVATRRRSDPTRTREEATRTRPAAGEAPGPEMTASEPPPTLSYAGLSKTVSCNPRVLLRALLVAALLLVSAGCTPEHEIVVECTDRGAIHAICDMQNPEDLALLPDGRTVVVSQFGLMDGSKPGSLALFDLETEAVGIAYVGGATGGGRPTPGWGDPECPGPPTAEFSPHGIDLAPRADGRLRLLVVNHGGRESIEFFEVVDGDPGAALVWRGCVIPPPNSYLNDVVNLPDGGLLTTHMMPRDGETMGMLRGALGMDTGHVLEWRAGGRWRVVAGTEAPFPNGIELSDDGRSVYVNAYLAGEVRRVDRETGDLLGVAQVPSPDNSSWGRDGRLLVASHRGGLADQTACFGLSEGACPMAFEVVAVDPETLETETIFAHAGPPMGAGTIALDLGDELLIGSFAADRMIRVPRGRLPVER